MNAAASGRAGDGCMDHLLQDTLIPLPQPTAVIWEVTLGRDQHRVFMDIHSLCIPTQVGGVHRNTPCVGQLETTQPGPQLFWSLVY